jgi:hypothetical protein
VKLAYEEQREKCEFFEVELEKYKQKNQEMESEI